MSDEELRAYAREQVDELDRAQDQLSAAEKALRDAPDNAARKALLESSILAPDRTASALILAALRSGDAEIARSAADMIMSLARTPFALTIVAECQGMEDRSLRRRAAEALTELAGPEAIPLLVHAMRDEDPSVALEAATAMEFIIGTQYHPLKGPVLDELENPQSELFRAIADNENVPFRRQLAQSLGYGGTQRVLPLLEELANDEDDEVRKQSVLSLAVSRTKRALVVLKGKLADKSHGVASAILDVLAAQLGIASNEFLEYLKLAMRHEAPEVRRHAVLMLQSYHLEQARDVLMEAAGDSDFEVQRRAREMLRHMGAGARSEWLPGQAMGESEDDLTLAVWEAGNIGLESGRTGESAAAAESEGQYVLSMLERAATEGSPSARMHAINEMSSLVDVADSEALQQGLHDNDPSVRSRAADSLNYSRNAGFLVGVLRDHPDPLVRRRALDPLKKNPGGPKEQGGLGRTLGFASTRTVGVELSGHFLRALGDHDEGVRQYACEAIEGVLQSIPFIPAGKTIETLQSAAEDEDASYFFRETAGKLIQTIEKAGAPELIAVSGGQVLEWRGRLARQAQALRFDEAKGHFVLEPADAETADEITETWPRLLRLDEPQADAIAGAVRSGAPVEESTANVVMRGFVRRLSEAAAAIRYASRAMALIGDERSAATLDQWQAAMKAGPRLQWGAGEKGRLWEGELSRRRNWARAAALAAREALQDEPNWGALDELTGDGDDWVRMAALTERACFAQDPGQSASELAPLCAKHRGDEGFKELLGPAAIVMLEAGIEDSLPLLASVLGAVGIDHRVELTQKLMMAAQDRRVAEQYASHVTGIRLAGLSDVCLACALRAAGGDVGGITVPESTPQGGDLETRCALDSLRSMNQDAEAAARLKEMLRGGNAQEQYCAAHYLGLARVRSAVPVFASTSDQEVPLAVRALCAGMLIRRGHPAGPDWFNRMLRSTSDEPNCLLLSALSRAIEDTINLMLRCNDVNVGRFV